MSANTTAYMREYMRARRARRKQAGLCIYGNCRNPIVSPGAPNCREHQDRQSVLALLSDYRHMSAEELRRLRLKHKRCIRLIDECLSKLSVAAE